MSSRINSAETLAVAEAPFDFEVVFRAQYARICRVILRVVHDPSRAEELAVEVFLELWRNTGAHGPRVGGWLYRVAVRKALDELRRRTRKERCERLIGFTKRVSNPEEIHAAAEAEQRVRIVLSALARRQAEILILRSQGLSYDELASVLALNLSSIGTHLGRAQEAFRKEYIKRYGWA